MTTPFNGSLRDRNKDLSRYKGSASHVPINVISIPSAFGFEEKRE